MTTVTNQMEIEPSRITVSANHRRHFDTARLQELANNIKTVGVLQPILVRLSKDVRGKGGFELIAGERRLRAAKMAGLETVPVRVLDVGGGEAAEIQAFENLHREDLTPIEEAQSFKLLLDAGGYDVKALAERMDKSEAYVYRSIKLLDLPEAGIKALEEGKITQAIAHQILRVAPEQRERMVKFAMTPHEWSKRLPTFDDVKDEIEGKVAKDLSDTIFPKDASYADEELCTTCPFNTGNQGALFDGATKGQCTNAKCFNAKTARALKGYEAKLQAKYPGFKSLGAVKLPGYGSLGTVKGNVVLDKELMANKAIQKAMQDTPEKFGVAVVKPSGYDNKKTLGGILVCLDETLLPKSARPKSGNENHQRELSPEEQKRFTMMQERLPWALAKAIAPNVKRPSAKEISEWAQNAIENGGVLATVILGVSAVVDIGKALTKAEPIDVLKVVMVSSDVGWNGIDQDLCKQFGVDHKKVVAEVGAQIDAELKTETKEPDAKKSAKKTKTAA